MRLVAAYSDSPSDVQTAGGEHFVELGAALLGLEPAIVDGFEAKLAREEIGDRAAEIGVGQEMCRSRRNNS